MKRTVLCLLSLTLIALGTLPVSAMAGYDLGEMDLRTPSGYTSQELESGLLKGLVPLAGQFIAAEEYYGVNAVFLAAVSALESGWGQSGWSKHNNIFGYGNKKAFDSKAKCIFDVTGAIRRNYLSPDGRYFKGYTIDGVNHYYNGRTQWAVTVESIMGDIICRIEKNRARAQALDA